MNILVLLILVLLSSFAGKTQVIMKGQIVLKDDLAAMPGVQVSLMDHAISTYSNAEGYFFIKLPKGNQPQDLRIVFPGMPSLHLLDVAVPEVDTVDLGRIAMVANRMISQQEFNQAKQHYQAQAKPIHHYATLIGYSLSNEVEASDLISNCTDKEGRPYRYQFDSATNTLTMDYQRIKQCR